ncbi:MAG: DUF2177 family protein [Burkholderiaceae bacterium]
MLKKTLLPWLAVVVAMMALDAIWLGVVATPLYLRGIGHLMADRPNFVAAALFYLLYAIGVTVFVVRPRAPGDRRGAALYGALFGLAAFVAYDLTNLATLRGWPVGLSVVDIAWGCVNTGVAATASKVVADRLR